VRPKKKNPYVRKDIRIESNQKLMPSSAGFTAFDHLLSLERSNILSDTVADVNRKITEKCRILKEKSGPALCTFSEYLKHETVFA